MLRSIGERVLYFKSITRWRDWKLTQRRIKLRRIRIAEMWNEAMPHRIWKSYKPEIDRFTLWNSR